MGSLFCKEGLQGIFVILFTKYIMFFLLFLPLSFPLSIWYVTQYLLISFIITTSVPSKIFKSFFACYMPQGRYCQEHGIDRNKVAQMFFFNGLASTIFRAITGRLCDFGRNVPIWIMRFTVCCLRDFGDLNDIIVHILSASNMFCCIWDDGRCYCFIDEYSSFVHIIHETEVSGNWFFSFMCGSYTGGWSPFGR